MVNTNEIMQLLFPDGQIIFGNEPEMNPQIRGSPSESNHILLGHCQRLQKVSSKSVRNFFQSRVLYILHIARGQTENNFVR